MRIAIVLYDGFDELDAIGPYEVLCNAAAGGADLSVELVTLEPVQHVTGSHGVEIMPHDRLERAWDMVIVPGGSWSARGEVGAWGEAERGELPAALSRLRDGGAQMVAVCTGAMLLSAAGITRGRRVTTRHRAMEALAAEGAEVVEARVVDDDDLVTAGGVLSGIDLALWLVERHFGGELADAVARGIEHERVGEVARRPTPAQAQTGAE